MNARFPIGAKFAVLLAVLVAALVAVGFSGLSGLANLNAHVRSLYQDHIVTLQRTSALADDSSRVAKVALQIIVSNREAEIARLEGELNTAMVPKVNADIDALRRAHAGDSRAERAKIDYLAALWGRFLALRRPLDAVTKGSSTTQHDNALAAQVRSIFDPIEQRTAQQTSLEASQSAGSARAAQASYQHTSTLLVLIGSLSILIGAAVVALLIRSVVPRVSRYSAFAWQVARGEASNGVCVTGRDELTELGTALNEMVERRVTERTRENAQSEFAEVMQVTETEREAHDLLKRQIERLIPDSTVVVLSRNNSEDRLDATTSVPEGSELTSALETAKPRSCLAVRFARTHTEGSDQQTLISCEVCGKSAGSSTCEPLLVGGEVIGSVLTSHPGPLGSEDEQTVRRSVAQAAPVLANLRNLAIAERRAHTDALTGLANNRNVADTVKHMVAHASRSVSSLAALALDLDHFKDINDTYGHASGDEVLAAVGSTLRAACRASDFVGRAGGEEFLVLLPDTGLSQAELVAEKLRLAIASITVPSVDQPITTSIGIAILPDHAGEANTLLRHADRALYTAKRNGRNRTEVFTAGMLSDGSLREATAAPPAPSPARSAARARS